MKSVTLPSSPEYMFEADADTTSSKGDRLRDILEQMKRALIQRATAMASV